MQNHIFRRIPDLNTLPRAQDKEERLKAIIANLEQSHRDARASMLQEAQRKLQSSTHNEQENDAMDIDQQGPFEEDTVFGSNMSVPHPEGRGDPCLSHGTVPTSNSGIQQAPTPREVEVYQQTVKQMTAYDKQAKQTRDFYVRALERQRSASSGSEQVRSPNGQVEGSRDPRRRSIV